MVGNKTIFALLNSAIKSVGSNMTAAAATAAQFMRKTDKSDGWLKQIWVVEI